MKSLNRVSCMRVTNLSIKHYRSIDDVTIRFPEGKPVVLFGPNNAGKSNILSAINRILGERYPTYVEMLDSDYYMRDKKQYSSSTIKVNFSLPVHRDRNGRTFSQIAVTYDGVTNDNLLHDGFGNRLYISNEERALCQSYLIDAERNIQGAFNYSSRYSVLSKFSHKIHDALSSEHKRELSSVFEQIKKAFNDTKEFANFFKEFSRVVDGSVKGFVHSLEADFSAYDPNNYARSLRIYAKEGDSVRGFEDFVLIIEEPEAHLHPLAQKWLKEYILELCSSGIQIIISTHSADFIDTEYLEGMIRVYKENGITKIYQLNTEELCSFCIATGCSPSKATPQNIADFYSTKLFPDQLKGMLTEKILLVEGETEYFALPIYLRKVGFLLPEHGIEIINCRGKNSIPLFWRLFKAYGYHCYFIFDCDESKGKNNCFDGIITVDNWTTSVDKFVITEQYAYFGKDFEHYFKSTVKNYNELEIMIRNEYGIISKQGVAKAIAQHLDENIPFIEKLKEALEKF